MIHKETFTWWYSEQECFEKISKRIPDDKIINVIPRGTKVEDDFWTIYYVDVIYKD